LPIGYRPPYTLVVPVVTAVGTDGTTSTIIPLIVVSTGSVQLGKNAASAGYISLDIPPFLVV